MFISIEKNVNKIQNRITFEIKSGHYPEFLRLKTMKLFGSTERSLTKDKIAENDPQLEITVVVLVHCNSVNNHY